MTWNSALGRKRKTAPDPLPLVTAVSLRVAQFIARHKPFVADFNVPMAVSHLTKLIYHLKSFSRPT